MESAFSIGEPKHFSNSKHTGERGESAKGMAFVSFWVIDRYGRKPLYIIGSLGMTAALVLLTSAVLMGRFHNATVLVYILAYLAFFSSCIGPVFWTLVAEIFPNDLRGTAMAVPVLTQWVTNAAVVLFFPLAFNQIGKAITFGFLATMALAQAIFTWFFVPETKNKPLEEIEEYWKRLAFSSSVVREGKDGGRSL
jgi:SP family arabinose:H+ symporter-like MFS transporter